MRKNDFFAQSKKYEAGQEQKRPSLGVVLRYYQSGYADVRTKSLSSVLKNVKTIGAVQVGQQVHIIWEKGSPYAVSFGETQGVASVISGTSGASVWGEITGQVEDQTDVVGVTNAQTISGIKTFTSFPLGPSSMPTQATELVTKGYVDTRKYRALVTVSDANGWRFVSEGNEPVRVALPLE